MNYLAHLYLSDPDPLCRLGNLLGDFIKGRLARRNLPAGLLKGLLQHRAVDRLAQTHPAVSRSKARLDNRFGHTRSILVDIFYDHLLARHWRSWAQGSLEEFSREAYALFRSHEDLLPAAFRPVADRMVAHDWLNAYADPHTIEMVLKQIAARLSRPTLLARGHEELARCAGAMAADCRAFLQDARRMLEEET